MFPAAHRRPARGCSAHFIEGDSHMKKLTILTVVLALAGAAACGKKKDTTTPATEPPAATEPSGSEGTGEGTGDEAAPAPADPAEAPPAEGAGTP
jgi:hypothetical protein